VLLLSAGRCQGGESRDEREQIKMSIKALKNRLATSGVFAFFVIATILLQQAGATTSSTYPCTAEYEACGSDTECSKCLLDGENVDEYTECVENFDCGMDDWCAALSIGPCCMASVSSNDCLGNNAFVEYWTCSINFSSTYAGYGECTTLTCSNGSGGEAADGTSGVGSSSPSAMLMFVLGLVGFSHRVLSFLDFSP